MPETIKLTREQARVKVAERRGWRLVPYDGFTRFMRDGKRTVDYPPDYFNDANAALELLEELPMSGLGIGQDGHGWRFEFWIADMETGVVIHEDFKTAIVLAWLQWRTGTPHELTD